MNVKAVCKSDSLALCQIGSDVLFENISLLLIGSKYHDNISFFGSFGSCINFKAEFLYMIPLLAALIKTDDNFYTAVTKIESVSVSLTAVADDGNGFSIELIDVTVSLIINFWHFKDLHKKLFKIYIMKFA